VPDSDSAQQGVLFPRGAEGRRGTMETNRAVFADAARAADEALAGRIEATGNWRSGYAPLVRELTELGARSARVATDIARAGLESVRQRMVLRRGDDDRPLSDAVPLDGDEPFATETVQGDGERQAELVVPYDGRLLRRDGLRRQLASWVARGIIEPSAATAVGEVIDHPDWVRMDGLRVAVIGAGAETSPLGVLSSWGVEVLALDLPRPQVWRALLQTARDGAGRVHVPVRGSEGEVADRAGANLIADLPDTAGWLDDRAGSVPLVLGFYVYADGGLHVQATAAADALASHLLAKDQALAPAYAGTPSDCYLVSEDVAGDSVDRRESRGLRRTLFEAPLEKVSGGRLYAAAYPKLVEGEDGRGWGVADGLVSEQGPNYALAKRIQRWQSIVAWSEGRPASFNVAPPTWTKSVTKNRLLAAGYYGARWVGMEVFQPDTMRTLMTALMVHDLHDPAATPPALDGTHPDELVDHGAIHGGYWRRPYNLHSTLVYTGILGLPEAYAPKLR